MQHVLRGHPDYDVVTLEATAAQTGSILISSVIPPRTSSAGWSGLSSATYHFPFVRAARQDGNVLFGCNYFGFTVEILLKYLIFDVCLDVCQLLQPRSHLRGRLRAGMDGVVVQSSASIASELPSRFGIMLDGWTNAFEHYIAVFACYEVKAA
ncbi:hypothetical protein GQ600_27409 [Phytophthora cactorum]|nr:hypothetical protein GQ600_27409 [Phytophthora cactorum]